MRGAKLGQHFLNAPSVARKLAASVGVRTGETILEIGPGKGALTRILLETRAPIVAIEKDPALVAILKNTFSAALASGELALLERDVRDVAPSALGLAQYVVAANIPYYITGEIIRHFLTADVQPRAMSLLIQKEVAERILARNGKESILSLSVKAYGAPSIIASVPAGCFSPPPRVDSAILHIGKISRAFFDSADEDIFFRVVKAGFASKRKMLAGNLKTLFENPGEALEKCGIDARARAEDVHLNEWKSLAQKLQR